LEKGRLMPRQGSLLFEDYEKVADEIHAKGENPTVSRTLEELGRGSRDTHNKYQKMWRKNRESDQAAIALTDEPLKKQVARVVQLLHDENDAKISEIKDEANAAVEAARTQQTAAENELAEIKSSLQITNLKLNDLAAAKALLELDLNDHRQEHFIRVEREQALQEKVELLQGESAARVKILEVQLEKIVKQYELHLKELNASHELSIDRLGKQQEEYRHRFLAEIDALKTVLKAKEIELEKNRKLELVCQKAEVENAALNTEREYLLEVNKTLLAKDVQQNEQYAALHTQLQKSTENIFLTNEGVKVTHGQLEGLANSLQEHFIATIKSIEDLKEKIKRADHADTA
jgi:hypothetical protein